MLDVMLVHRFILLRRYPMWWYLWFAALGIAVMIPESVVSVGFWYSFFITFNLMVFVPKFIDKIYGPTWFVGYVVASLVAVVSSFPIQIMSNSMIDLNSVSSNLWVSWLGTLILFIGLVGYLSWLVVPFIGVFLFRFVDLLCDIMLDSMVMLQQVSLRIAFDRVESFLILGGALVVLFMGVSAKIRTGIVVLCGFMVGWMLHPPVPHQWPQPVQAHHTTSNPP
jgi:hypothetical protein